MARTHFRRHSPGGIFYKSQHQGPDNAGKRRKTCGHNCNAPSSGPDKIPTVVRVGVDKAVRRREDGKRHQSIYLDI